MIEYRKYRHTEILDQNNFCPHTKTVQTKYSGRMRVVCDVCNYEVHFTNYELRCVVVDVSDYLIYYYNNEISIVRKSGVFSFMTFPFKKMKYPGGVELTTIFEKTQKILLLL